MKNLSLKQKIALVGVVPLLCFIGFAIIEISREYQSYANSNKVLLGLNLIKETSFLIHETQIERGLSIAYLNGKPFENLNKQREATDLVKKRFENLVPISNLSDNEKKSTINLLQSYHSLRQNVENNSIPSTEALNEYSEIIKKLLQIETNFGNQSGLTMVSEGIKTLRIMEDSKENGGLLRATVSGILTKNNPLSNEQMNRIIQLKSGIDGNLVSSGLVLNEKSMEYIHKFHSSSDWQNINDIILTVLKHAEKGEYNYDSSKFFEQFTLALNIIGDLIIYQITNLNNLTKEINTHAYKSLVVYCSILIIMTLSLTILIIIISRSINNSLLNVISRLTKGSELVGKSSADIAKSSQNLSESSLLQASSLHETVASIDEISAMVNRNADAAESSKKTVQKGYEVSNRGLMEMKEFQNTIQEISNNNLAIMEQMEISKVELAEITKVIASIGEKTKVINDIVFQTKLLSFNASVEAARAGEQGKGFAVVADEIGKLASMSGNAASEIKNMLDESIKTVDHIVLNINNTMIELINRSKDSVSNGVEKARICNDVLEEIKNNISIVNERVIDIATASKEQSIGVTEITKAVSQLDEVTKQNSNDSVKSSQLAQSLHNQSIDLANCVNDLLAIIGNYSENLDTKVHSS